MTSNLKVSIITPCYNAEKYLPDTYESLKSQTFQNWEWIVIDDCSTDRSFQILQNLSKVDSRIKLHQNPSNKGVSETRNTGLSFAGNDLIAFLDADDLWMPTKLEQQVRWHESGEKFTFHSILPFSDTFEKAPKVNQGTFQYSDILKNNIVPTSATMIEASIAKKHRFQLGLSRGEDMIYFLSVLSETKSVFGHIEVLSKYRISAQSLSYNKIKMAQSRWHIYRKILKLNLCSSVYYFAHYFFTGIRKTI